MTAHTLTAVLLRLIGFGICIYTVFLIATVLLMAAVPATILGIYFLRLIVGIAICVFAKPLSSILTWDIEK